MRKRHFKIKNRFKLTEEGIQNYLYVYLLKKRVGFLCPNSTLFGWESDLLSVSELGLMSEYEIKIDRRDLLRDLRKNKHRYFKKRYTKKDKFGRESLNTTPAYFYYVVPFSLNVEGFKLPSYAGLIKINESGTIYTHKRAPRLHNERINDRNLKYLGRGLMLRYWRERFKNSIGGSKNAI